eukprot:1657749-Prymnesium_polylepis.1
MDDRPTTCTSQRVAITRRRHWVPRTGPEHSRDCMRMSRAPRPGHLHLGLHACGTSAHAHLHCPRAGCGRRGGIGMACALGSASREGEAAARGAATTSRTSASLSLQRVSQATATAKSGRLVRRAPGGLTGATFGHFWGLTGPTCGSLAPIGLARRVDELLPEVAARLDGVAAADGGAQRDDHALAVDFARHKVCVARKRRVHRVVRQLQAQDVVGGVRRGRADHVRGVCARWGSAVGRTRERRRTRSARVRNAQASGSCG